jgi:hypothetical protein
MMQKHITILGALYIAFSIPTLLAAIIVFISVVGGGLLSCEAQAIAITSAVGTVIAYFLILISIPGFIAGYGLLKSRPWARILGLILGFLNLINIPFGTVLGIYAIWVLLHSETEKIFIQTVKD